MKNVIYNFQRGSILEGERFAQARSCQCSRFKVKQVNCLKLIKRQMFGRAKFDLLRLQVMHAV